MTSSQTGGGLKTTDGMKLLNVQVFFRHGARTPLRPLEGVEEVNLLLRAVPVATVFNHLLHYIKYMFYYTRM